MKQKIFLTLFISLLTIFHALAQSEPEIVLSIVGNETIADVNLDQDKYIASTGKLLDLMKKEFKDISKEQKIAVLFVGRKTGKPVIEIYGDPKLSAEKEQHFLKEAGVLQLENTKLVDFPILLSINLKDPKLGSDIKEIIIPAAKQRSEYENADLKKQYELNKAWAINEVLPVLSAYQTMVDPKFAGVKNFGTLVSKTNFSEVQDLAKITSKNPDYWRAVLEMNVGNQLIPVTKIFTHVAQGEIDHAKMYLDIVDIFSDPKSTANNYLSQLSWRLGLFNKQLNTAIGKGIAEHDKGKYQDAIKIYNTVLQSYPNSAWGLYELYYSQNALDIKNEKVKTEDRSKWDVAKIRIYQCNPLYGMDVRASNGKEGYLLFRRQEISQLFKSKVERLNDVYKYADIAMDLDVYDFAAQLFWFSVTFNKDNKKALPRFLYCLEKLGVNKLKENFNGDFESEFKKIDKEKESEMTNSPMYKSFKN